MKMILPPKNLMRQRNGLSRDRKRAGMILVVTLAIIVLVTVAVLAFFSHAISNRQVESSRTNRTEAALLAHTGQDYVTGLFLAEIAANSSNSPVNGVTMYFPNSPTNSLARRMMGPGVSVTDTNFFNLIRQSVPGADTNASANNTAETARNGRLITAERWNAPRLLGGQGFQTNQLPNWIYVTRSGGITSAPSRDVIGRFAYNAYDIGGLLDVSAAGYPSGPSGMAATNISSLKSTVAGADLTQLPGMTTNAVNDLLGFRNPGTTSATYTNAVSALAQKGFLTSRATNSTGTFTNNAFMNRQDLLRYARLQNTALTNALPYLTHFSRSLNAPTWTPVNPTNSTLTIDYEAGAENPAKPNRNISNVRFSSPGNIIHYRDDGTIEPYSATETAYSYKVKAGDPLVQRRFSLAKLAWLTPTGPATGISNANAAILACFGLQWNPGEDRWDYIPTEADEIKTLAQVAADNREPNFFELLKAGILEGSLGLISTDQYTSQNPMKTLASLNVDTVDGSKDLQIIAIGANIIDCADSDNYPTIVALPINGSSYERAGIEDLPYLYCLSMAAHRKMTVISSPYIWTLYNFDGFWVPEFFSVHQQSSPSSGPGSISMSLTGTRHVVCFIGGGLYMDMTQINLAALGSIVISATSFNTFRGAPCSFVDDASPNRMGSLLSNVDPSVENVTGFHIYSYPGATGQPAAALTMPRVADIRQSPWVNSGVAVGTLNMIVRLQYPAASPPHRLKTYATLGGNEADPSTGIQGTYDDWWTLPTMKQGHNVANLRNHTNLSAMTYMTTGDPRSSRFGPSLGQYMRPMNSLPKMAGATVNDSIGSRTTPGALGGSLDQWSKEFRGVADPDGISRPTDATLGNSTYRDIIQNAERRPVVLQRPYRTVAELGYVFRDTPWKTLDLSDASSADAGLLDLFAVSDQPAVTAGRTNLNTPYREIRQALLLGEGQVPDGTNPLPGNVITALADRYQALAFLNGAPTADMPGNVAKLTKFMSDTTVQSSLSGSPLNYKQEAVVRALADATQTRTWNVLIDVVAQVGRFAGTTFGPGDFLVEGENRCWLSVAIDRYTGNVVDFQNEAVNE